MFVVSNEAQGWDYVSKLRKDLLQYLKSIDEKDWDKASLCKGWLVRDVVAHLIIEYRYTFWNAWGKFILSGFNRLVGVAKRTRGLQFVATDIGVTRGVGQIVKGKAQDILFVVSGRSVSAGSLFGDGAKILLCRVV